MCPVRAACPWPMISSTCERTASRQIPSDSSTSAAKPSPSRINPSTIIVFLYPATPTNDDPLGRFGSRGPEDERSEQLLGALFLRPEVRKRDHVPDAGTAHQDHGQTIHPEAQAAGGGHPVFQGGQE